MHDPRPGLLRALEEGMRRVTAQSVLISDLVAARVGLNSTDLEVLDFLYLAGRTTAGRLAEQTRLTTGATTAVIDRLERAGFVRRRRDAEDRRRVFVEVVPARVSRIHRFYVPLAAGMAQVCERYDDRDLAVVVDFLSRAFGAGAEHIAWLQARVPERRRIRTPRPRGTPPRIRRARRADSAGA